MQIYAHRGVWLAHPENSMGAFTAALKRGYSIETDLRKTKDNHIVISHDSSMKRATGVDKDIATSTLAELRSLRITNDTYAGEERIPLLSELLEHFKDYAKENSQLALQLKSFEPETATLIADIIRAFDKQHPEFRIFKRTFLFDVTKEIGHQLKRYEPKLLLSYSLSEETQFPDDRYPTIFTATQLENESTCDLIWGDEWENGLYTKELIDHYKKQGKQFIAISPELHGSTDPRHPHAGNPAELRKMWHNLISWGVDGICTDYTEELSTMLEENAW